MFSYIYFSTFRFRIRQSGLGRIMSPTQIKAVLGQYKISDYKENAIDSEAYEVNVKQIVPHPDYDCSSADNDIGTVIINSWRKKKSVDLISALLEMAEPIKFDAIVKPACIAMKSSGAAAADLIADGQTATVSGWGWTDENQEIGLMRFFLWPTI